MAASCDDHELNQRIIDAFRAHYDDMVEAMSVCAGKVARILYEIKIIHIETMKEASEVGWSKYQKSFTVVNAIDVYIKSRESSSHSVEVLDILEKHPPLDGVVAKIRKHMQHSRTVASSFEESMSIEEEVISNEGTNSNAGTDSNPGTDSNTGIDSNVIERTNSSEGTNSSNEGSSARPPKLKRSRYRLPSSLSGEYTDLKWRFGKLKRTTKSLILDKPEDGLFSTLKDQLLYMYSEDEMTCSIIREAVDTAELLDNVVLRRCTVTNYSLLRILARELKIPEILDEIKVFSESKDNLEGSLLEGEFAEAVKTEISRHQTNSNLPLTEITLKVNMMESEATLNEFRSLIEEIFPLLYQYIDLEVTKKGCVCFVCYAPEYLEAVLIQMARDQVKVALQRRVIFLSVGLTPIIDIDIPVAQQVATKSKESLLTQEAASSLPLPPPPTQEKATVSQPKEPVVEEVTPSPLLPTVSKPTQVNVVSSVSSVDAHDFPWERLLTWSAMALLVLSLLAVYNGGNGEVVCDSPPHLSNSVVNSACQQSLSRWSYYPFFVFLQSIVLLLPQYLWYSYSKWHVQFFFSALQRFSQQPFTAEGECELEAFQALAKVEEQFSKTRGLVKLYTMKMVLHLILWATCSAITLMFFGQFKCPKSILPTRYSYDCDRDSLNDSPFIDCFYSQLQNLVAANCFILLISLASIVYSFGWFYLQPIKTTKDMINFCLDSHLSPMHFLDSISVSWASSDFDFLVQLLGHVDSSLIATFQEKQACVHTNRSLTKQAEVFRLMKYVQQYGYLAGEDGSPRDEDKNIRDRHFEYGFADDIDSKLQSAHAGVLGSTDTPPLPSVHKLIFQCLHYAVNPADNACALDITFGTAAYGTVLGRAFVQAVSVCYLSQLSGSRVTPANKNHCLSHARVTLPDTIYDQRIEDINNGDDAIRDSLLNDVNPKYRGDPKHTTILAFIIIGPIQDRRSISTVNILLSNLYSFCCFKRNCCMLTLRPIKIGSHDVTDVFHKFVPVERMFKLDEEKKEISGEVPIQCGPLRCVFEVKLYRFRDYGFQHQLYRPPPATMNSNGGFPEVDNAYCND